MDYCNHVFAPTDTNQDKRNHFSTHSVTLQLAENPELAPRVGEKRALEEEAEAQPALKRPRRAVTFADASEEAPTIRGKLGLEGDESSQPAPNQPKTGVELTEAPEAPEAPEPAKKPSPKQGEKVVEDPNFTPDPTPDPTPKQGPVVGAAQNDVVTEEIFKKANTKGKSLYCPVCWDLVASIKSKPLLQVRTNTTAPKMSSKNC